MQKEKKSKPLNMNSRGLVALIIVAALALGLIGRLFFLQLIKGDEYSAKAENQQLSDTPINAGRGTIYDSNMNVLAQSASVWLVYIDPSKISSISKDDKREAVREAVVSGLSGILEVDEEVLREYTFRDTSYQVVKRGIEKDTRDALNAMIDEYSKREENKIDLSNIIGMQPDVKRYYPYSTVASTVIGFIGNDGNGLAGLEYFYDETLTGVNGRTITAKDGTMAVMPNQYETIYEAQNGTNLVLSLDIYIQNILENVLAEAIENTKAENVYGIVMDVDKGAVLAMVSLPDYDLNDPRSLKSEILSERYEAGVKAEESSELVLDENDMPVEAKPLSYYQNLQWSNRTIVSTYEPGSVFKVITASAALEEGKADLNTDYYCNASIDYATRTIHCWKSGGHGAETFVDLLKNSCNPFAVTLADRVGTQRYYDYFEAFGFTEKTGIDMPGETTPKKGVLYMARESFSKSDLASYSFGQSFQVSPLQMITAISAVANGGKLMTPYIVSKTVNDKGNTISETQPKVRRQVISESTAQTIRYAMEEVVSTGTGKNAYVPGYHVAGKTGTSEKLTQGENGAYIASFCGFAPANDPKISVIIIVDEPKGEHGGGSVAAPLAGEVFEQVLTYMGVERSYSNEEMQVFVETAPQLVGLNIGDAKALVASKKLDIRVVGDGSKVVAQCPEYGREISAGGIVVVYTEDDYTEKKITVPDFTGCTVNEANRVAINSGLNIKITGSSANGGAVYAYKQSIPYGTEVNMGEIINVSFKTTVDVSD